MPRLIRYLPSLSSSLLSHHHPHVNTEAHIQWERTGTSCPPRVKVKTVSPKRVEEIGGFSTEYDLPPPYSCCHRVSLEGRVFAVAKKSAIGQSSVMHPDVRHGTLF